MIIYLGGSIHSKSWDEAAGWRDDVTRHLEASGHEVRNPLRNRLWSDPDDQKQFHPNELVHRDIADITASDGILCEYADSSANFCGTSMELWEAHRQGKFIVVYVGDRKTWSPWLDYVATKIIRTTWEDCIRYINNVLDIKDKHDDFAWEKARAEGRH